REIDIIEEILRIYGYNKIPLTGRINASLSNNIENTSEKRKRIIADYLVNNGFTEIMCNSLTSSTLYENNPIFPLNKSVKILNPLSRDLNVLRQTLLYGGLEIILYNQNRKIQDVKLFEFGNVYKIDELPEKENNALNKYKENEVLALFIGGNKHPETWYLPITKVDFFYLKAHVFNILKKLSIEPDKLQKKEYYNKKFFTEGLSLIYKDDTIVELGKIETNITKKFGLKETIFYAEFMWNKIIEIFNNINFKVKDLSKFPEVRRDLALIIHKKIKYSEIEKLAYKIAHPLL
ncbi:MAG TPA: phenylalanine--tRNA ligase subunit beta, partial [Bacteroidales bacterium]|nr:phenylalanine--tRNA ligase subunit beta [Bacteroidales bacterium]